MRILWLCCDAKLQNGAQIQNMPAVTLDYATPDESLRQHLSVFYEFRADVPLFEDVERADLAQVRFQLAGSDATYTFADGTVQKASPSPQNTAARGSTGRCWFISCARNGAMTDRVRRAS